MQNFKTLRQSLLGELAMSRKKERGGERRERKNAIYSGHLRLCQQPRAAHALRSDQYPTLMGSSFKIITMTLEFRQLDYRMDISSWTLKHLDLLLLETKNIILQIKLNIVLTKMTLSQQKWVSLNIIVLCTICVTQLTVLVIGCCTTNKSLYWFFFFWTYTLAN